MGLRSVDMITSRDDYNILAWLPQGRFYDLRKISYLILHISWHNCILHLHALFPFLYYSLRYNYLNWVFHIPRTFIVPDMPGTTGASSSGGKEVVEA